MKTKVIILALALGASTCLLTAQDGNPPPEGKRPPGGFHVLPPRAQEQLSLTADQQKQISDLEAEVKAKIEKILTPEQLEQLKKMRPPHPPGPPPGSGGPEGHGPDDKGAGQAGPQSGGGKGAPRPPCPSNE